MTTGMGALGAPVPVVSSPRFFLWCPGWTEGLAFSELSGFSSSVEPQEYSYSGWLGVVHTKQFGRPKPPQITMKRPTDHEGFARIFAWHMLARTNCPVGGKVPATFTIMDKSGIPHVACELKNAWCSRLELDPVRAGDSGVVFMKVTVECDQVLLV